MRYADIVALADADATRTYFQRLIPLAQPGRFDSLPLEARQLFLVVEWLGEVSNGGTRQYFGNSSGDRFDAALAALEVICPVGAAVLREAQTAFPKHQVPDDRAVRNYALGLYPEISDPVLARADEATESVRSEVFAALGRFLRAHGGPLSVIDRYPSGLKAMAVTDNVPRFFQTLKETREAFETEEAALELEDSFGLITWGAFLSRGGLLPSSSALQTFTDVFDMMDEVSAGGFKDWLFCGVADRHAHTRPALLAVGATEMADLVERALAVCGPNGLSSDTQARRLQIAALAKPDELDSEAQTHRSDLAQRLARYLVMELPPS